MLVVLIRCVGETRARASSASQKLGVEKKRDAIVCAKNLDSMAANVKGMSLLVPYGELTSLI